MAQCVPTTAIKCILFKRAFLEKCIVKTCNFLVLRSLLSSVSQLSQPPFEDFHCLVINSSIMRIGDGGPFPYSRLTKDPGARQGKASGKT